MRTISIIDSGLTNAFVFHARPPSDWRPIVSGKACGGMTWRYLFSIYMRARYTRERYSSVSFRMGEDSIIWTTVLSMTARSCCCRGTGYLHASCGAQFQPLVRCGDVQHTRSIKACQSVCGVRDSSGLYRKSDGNVGLHGLVVCMLPRASHALCHEIYEGVSRGTSPYVMRGVFAKKVK